MIHRSAFFLLAFAQIQMAASSVYADSPVESIEKFIASITSVEVAKTKIRNAMEESNECPTGSCMDSYYTLICDIVAALDVSVGGKILDSMVDGENKLAISSSDVREMRKIIDQCKPSNYQYWRHGQLVHVVYRPDEKSGAEIDKYLGID